MCVYIRKQSVICACGVYIFLCACAVCCVCVVFVRVYAYHSEPSVPIGQEEAEPVRFSLKSTARGIETADLSPNKAILFL